MITLFKSVLIGVASLIFWNLIIYSMFAFYTMQANPIMWGEDVRLLFCYFGYFLGVVGSIFAGYISYDIINKEK
jgi:hypothetical protein